MPFVISGSRRGGRIAAGLAAVAAGAAFAAVAPAPASAGLLDLSLSPSQSGVALNLLSCQANHATAATFSPWGDANQYAPAPGGGFEGLLTSWSGLGATVVAGNEPWNVGGAKDAKSLRIPGKVAVRSPQMCIDASYPSFRFFAKNVGAAGSLDVAVSYLDRNLRTVTTDAGTLRSTGTGWTVADPMKIAVDFGADANAAAPVQFRFTASAGSDWRLDDLYIDPFARR
jgi:hypothetical protein